MRKLKAAGIKQAFQRARAKLASLTELRSQLLSDLPLAILDKVNKHSTPRVIDDTVETDVLKWLNGSLERAVYRMDVDADKLLMWAASGPGRSRSEVNALIEKTYTSPRAKIWIISDSLISAVTLQPWILIGFESENDAVVAKLKFDLPWE